MSRGHDLRRISSPSKGMALAREAGASLLTYHLYPLGWVGKKTPLISAWRHPAKKHVPILLVHGVFHNRSAFAWIVQRLAAQGFRHFRELDLLTSRYGIPELAQQVAREAAILCDAHGVDQIDIIGHSLGGLVSRYYVQKLGGDGKVRYLFTLGSPHQGTILSRYALIRHIRELRPDSQTLRDLNSCPYPEETLGVSISGDLDLFTRRHAYWWEGARNIYLKGVGHAGLLFSKRVTDILVTHLSV